MSNLAFSAIDLPDRTDKPREAGLTMVIDWGIGIAQQEDLLRAAAPYLDLAKIAVGVSGLLPLDYLREKLGLYADHDVTPFPGGQYLEYAEHLGKATEFYESAIEAGYSLIEVSDNTVPIATDRKGELIATAVNDYGLRVLGETGSKLTASDADAMIADIRNCLDAGAWKVFVEAAEIVEDGLKEDLVDQLTAAVPAQKLIFELPGTWLHGVTNADRYAMMQALIAKFGADVNLANVETNEVLFVETLRRNIGAAGYELVADADTPEDLDLGRQDTVMQADDGEDSEAPRRQLTVAWSDLEWAFEDASYETQHYLDLQTGEVISVTDDARRESDRLLNGIDPDADDWEAQLESALAEADLPDWQKDAVRESVLVEFGFGTRFVEIPTQESHQGYDDMADFIKSVASPQLRNQLERAIQGRGAFRRFKDTVAADTSERERWFEFHDQRVRGRIVEWLRGQGIEPQTS